MLFANDAILWQKPMNKSVANNKLHKAAAAAAAAAAKIWLHEQLAVACQALAKCKLHCLLIISTSLSISTGHLGPFTGTSFVARRLQAVSTTERCLAAQTGEHIRSSALSVETIQANLSARYPSVGQILPWPAAISARAHHLAMVPIGFQKAIKSENAQTASILIAL